MTFHPIVAPLLLAAVIVAIVAARVVALRRMTDRRRNRVALWRWVGLTAAALLLTAAAARPTLGADAEVTRIADDRAANVFLVVDRSPEMSADGAGGPSRMAAARADVAALLDRYPDARFAVITFAARPSLDWPLSQDIWSLRPVMAALEPYPSPPGGVAQTNVGAAGTVLRYQLIAAAQQYPRAANLVFYLGAGAGGPDAPAREFDLPDGAVDGGAVLGYDAAEGGAALRAAADQIGVPYLARDRSVPLDDVLQGDGDTGATIAAATPSSGRTELYWAPAIAAAALILVELYFVLLEFRRTRMATTDVIR